jgi:hypothetical protein
MAEQGKSSARNVTTISISKIDAAKSQLETAIQLFFQNGDAVSVHTLVRAAHEILEVLCAGKDKKSMMKEIMENVKEDKVDELTAIINEPKNFFKHASRDPAQEIEFNPESSDLFLWDGCKLYQALTGEMPKMLYLFNLWFNLSHPNLFANQDFKEILKWIAKSFNPGNKPLFYAEASSAYDTMQSRRKSK